MHSGKCNYCNLSYIKGISSNIIEIKNKINAIKDIYKNEYTIKPITLTITGDSGTGKNFIAESFYNCNSKCYKKNYTIINCNVSNKNDNVIKFFDISNKKSLYHTKKDVVILDNLDKLHCNYTLNKLEYYIEYIIQHKINIILISISEKKNLFDVGSSRHKFYKLNKFNIHLRPLNQREDDILVISQSYINNLLKKNINHNFNIAISDDYKSYIQSKNWKGNVSELISCLNNLFLKNYSKIYSKSLDLVKVNTNNNIYKKSSIDYQNSLHESSSSYIRYNYNNNLDKEHLKYVLNLCSWNITKTAIKLNTSRTTIYRRLKKYKLTT